MAAAIPLGGTGRWPVPSGDPPLGTGSAPELFRTAVFMANDGFVPSGPEGPGISQVFQSDGACFSLSSGERAGVRAGVIHTHFPLGLMGRAGFLHADPPLFGPSKGSLATLCRLMLHCVAVVIRHWSLVVRHFALYRLLLFCATALPAAAHLPSIAAALVTVQPDGKYSLDLTFDVPPFVLSVTPQAATDDAMNAWLNGSTNALIASLAAAQSRFSREFTVLADAGTNRSAGLRFGSMKSGVTKIIFPTAADLGRYKESVPIVQLPVMLMLSLEGRLPAGTRSVKFQFPAVMGVVAVTVNRPGQEPATLVANSGEATEPIPVQLTSVAAAPRQIDVGFVVSNQTAGGPAGSTQSPTGLAAPKLSDGGSVPEPGRWLVARQYLRLGFEHILPEGTDHILFVLGLFLLSCRLKPLLWQVTAFTVAHSITLGLAMYGIFRLPSSVVEPLIAASIAFVAVENICTPELKPWRPVVVFCFGLIHGLGFSSVLLSLGLPRNDFAPALVAFNCGVELGQLTVIMAAFLLVGWWRNRKWYRRAIVIPASALIAMTGLFWTVQRIALAMR